MVFNTSHNDNELCSRLCIITLCVNTSMKFTKEIIKEHY